MKTRILLVIICSMLNSLYTFGVEIIGSANLRQNNKRLSSENVVLKNLRHKDKLDGLNFSIHYQFSENAIEINDSELSKKAQNVYYHLEKAREFFIESFGESSLSHMAHTIIRIETPNGFSQTAKYFKDESFFEYNNAISIPKSTTDKNKNILGWEHEIWFRPKKVLKIENDVHHILKSYHTSKSNREVQRSIISTQGSKLLADFISDGAVRTASIAGHTEYALTAMAIAEILTRSAEFASRKIKMKKFLDTAMIPEVIYHEFFHVAFANKLTIFNSDSIKEGYANFFSLLVAKRSSILKNTKQYSRGYSHLNLNSKIKYNFKHEHESLKQSAFVLILLNSFYEIVGDQFVHVLFEAADELNEAKNIKYDFVNNIYQRLLALNLPQNKLIRIHKVLQQLDL